MELDPVIYCGSCMDYGTLHSCSRIYSSIFVYIHLHLLLNLPPGINKGLSYLKNQALLLYSSVDDLVVLRFGAVQVVYTGFIRACLY